MDEVVRMFLVLGHLLALMGAAVGVAFGDYALLGRRHIHHPLLEKASHGVALALGGLWLTGLGLIWVDTRFDMALLWSKPKLLAKLTVVLLCSKRPCWPRVPVPSAPPAGLLASSWGWPDPWRPSWDTPAS
jgi:hypothetical protein